MLAQRGEHRRAIREFIFSAACGGWATFVPKLMLGKCAREVSFYRRRCYNRRARGLHLEEAEPEAEPAPAERCTDDGQSEAQQIHWSATGVTDNHTLGQARRLVGGRVVEEEAIVIPEGAPALTAKQRLTLLLARIKAKQKDRSA